MTDINQQAHGGPLAAVSRQVKARARTRTAVRDTAATAGDDASKALATQIFAAAYLLSRQFASPLPFPFPPDPNQPVRQDYEGLNHD